MRNEILLSYERKVFESVLLRWMNLEPVTQSEVSQKEKNKYRILTHIYVSGKCMLLGSLTRHNKNLE